MDILSPNMGNNDDSYDCYESSHSDDGEHSDGSFSSDLLARWTLWVFIITRPVHLVLDRQNILKLKLNCKRLPSWLWVSSWKRLCFRHGWLLSISSGTGREHQSAYSTPAPDACADTHDVSQCQFYSLRLSNGLRSNSKLFSWLYTYRLQTFLFVQVVWFTKTIANHVSIFETPVVKELFGLWCEV